MFTEARLSLRFIFFISAILIYAFTGSPTPDHPGVVELVVGVFLIAATFGGLITRLFYFSKPESMMLRLLHFLFLLGLIMPTTMGFYHGNDLLLIMRDLAAFCFVCLPLFMLDIFEKNPRARPILTWLILVCGLIFAIRTLSPVLNVWSSHELLYLANSPLVLWAALFLTVYAWRGALRPTLSSFGAAVAAFMGVVVCLAAMMMDVQRATFGAVVISFICLWLITLIKTPRKILLPTFFLILVGFFLWPQQQDIMDALFRKTAAVGLNMRLQEAAAVFHALAVDPLTALFGAGWGAVFPSPAVGGLWVNYTHSYLTTMALKGGGVMLLASILLCAAVFHSLYRVAREKPIDALMLFWPFAIPVFLYASHKSLDFGLTLLLIAMWSIPLRRLPKAHSSCMEKEDQNFKTLCEESPRP